MLTFHHTGDWGPDDVDVVWVPSGRRIVPEVEALIEEAWARATARPGVHLFDGPMCRLEEWEVTSNGRLRLALSETTYKPFFGTNMTHPDLADRVGPEVMGNPVGVSPALETADGFLMLGRRNQSVAYYPGRVHPFAGALEPGDNGDLFQAVRRELREELSLDGVTDGVRCTGIGEDRALRQTEFIFRARANVTRAEVERRLDAAEHRGTWSVAATPGAVAAAVREPMLTPVAVASLLLWGRQQFGDAWFDAARSAT